MPSASLLKRTRHKYTHVPLRVQTRLDWPFLSLCEDLDLIDAFKVLTKQI